MKKNSKSSRGRTPEGAPNPVDVHIGNRIRIRRQQLQLSQEKLADKLGLTFQQIQKYERGVNRAGGSRLWDLSRMLQTDVNYFYADMDEETINQSPRNQVLMQTDLEDLLPQAETAYDPMQDSENIQLITALTRIKNPELRNHLRQTIILASRSTPWPDSQKDKEGAD